MLGDDKNKPTDPNYPDNERSTYLSPTYGRGNFTFPAPSDTIPEDSSTPRATLRLILDEIDLDAPNSSDLGSYICDYMDPEADELIRRTIGKVFIDQSEYPKTAEIGHRVAKMIQRWYHGTGEPTMTGEHRKILGTVTIGSSEAIMMALIAHRHNWMVKWEERRGDPVTLAVDCRQQRVMNGVRGMGPRNTLVEITGDDGWDIGVQSGQEILQALQVRQVDGPGLGPGCDAHRRRHVVGDADAGDAHGAEGRYRHAGHQSLGAGCAVNHIRPIIGAPQKHLALGLGGF